MSATLWVYLIPALLIMGLYLWFNGRRHESSKRILEEAIASGLSEPASLHPLINPGRCLGCASCIGACPEKDVLGLIHGKAQLVNPSHCIGHGACKTACPFDAIELVFGTEKRGLDIPEVNPDYQTNVPGIFIAGELGGMGLIRNAVNQGVQAVTSVSKLANIGSVHPLDLVIVGAGPAGIAASLAAKEKKLRFVTLEQESLGGTVSHYPRGKIVMTAPVVLPIVGKMHFKETTKEALMSFWEGIIKTASLKINTQERVESVSREQTGFKVNTSKQVYQTHAILLAIGRRGTPRKLGVPGEDKSKVVYRLIDAEQYRNQHVLVVGGGDSALEAAISIAEEVGTQVTLSYRSEAFSRVKEKNRVRLAAAEKNGRLQVLMKSVVKHIGDQDVMVDVDGALQKITNDAVIVCAGGILPTAFLQEIGISVETKFGTA